MNDWRRNMSQHSSAATMAAANPVTGASAEAADLAVSNDLLDKVLIQKSGIENKGITFNNETVESENTISENLDEAVKNVTSYHVHNLLRMVTKSLQ